MCCVGCLPPSWGLVFALQGGYVLELLLSEEDANYADKVDVLEINELPEPCQFQLRADQPPEGGFLAFLRLLNCSGTCRQARISLRNIIMQVVTAVDRAASRGWIPRLPLSPQLLRQVSVGWEPLS